MKVISKSMLVAGVVALGLSLTACKKNTDAQPQADDASEAAEAAPDASDSATAMVAPVASPTAEEGAKKGK